MQSAQTSPPPAHIATRDVEKTARPAASLSRVADLTIRTERFDGIAWTCLPGAEELLARIPAEAWRDPGGQPGWRCVKRNAARAVWRARTDVGTFFLKFYYEHDWRARLKRRFGRQPCRDEWNCSVYALREGIRAARPLAHTDAIGGGGPRQALLISEAIEPAMPLDEFWLRIRDEREPQRRRLTHDLCDNLAELIGHAHQAGFAHLDMHAANIVVSDPPGGSVQAAFVDVQSARLGAALDDAAVIRNLAQLNQWFRRHARLADRLRFLRAYLRWRLEYEQLTPHARPLNATFRDLFAALNAAAAGHAERLWSRRDRRVGRAGKYFAKIRTDDWRGVAARRRRWARPDCPPADAEYGGEWWRAALSDPLKLFEGRACKDSHSAAVALATLEAQGQRMAVVVKRPLARSGWRRWRQALPPSRSRRGWRIGHALLNRNIAAAAPVALLERRTGPFVRDQLLVTEFVPDALDLRAHLQRELAERSRRSWGRHKRVLAVLLGRFVRTLHDRGFIHRDCKAENILVVAGTPPRLVWIDFDGIRLTRRVSPAQRLRTLARLHVSLLGAPGITRVDRARCVRAYFRGMGRDPRAWRAAWTAVAPLVREKTAQRAARRAWKREHYGRE